jgi:hypothetical protein
MKISVELDKELIVAIDLASDIQEISRDAAFKEALETWVAHKPKSKGFSIDPRSVEFDPDFTLEVDRPGPEAFSVPGRRVF